MVRGDGARRVLRRLPGGAQLRALDAIRLRGRFRGAASHPPHSRFRVTARIASELGDLGGEWNRLAQASSTPFLTTEWLDSWWSAFGSGKPAWMLLCADDGSLRAGALLQNGRGGALAAAAKVPTRGLGARGRGEGARGGPWGSPA